MTKIARALQGCIAGAVLGLLFLPGLAWAQSFDITYPREGTKLYQVQGAGDFYVSVRNINNVDTPYRAEVSYTPANSDNGTVIITEEPQSFDAFSVTYEDVLTLTNGLNNIFEVRLIPESGAIEVVEDVAVEVVDKRIISRIPIEGETISEDSRIEFFATVPGRYRVFIDDSLINRGTENIIRAEKVAIPSDQIGQIGAGNHTLRIEYRNDSNDPDPLETLEINFSVQTAGLQINQDPDDPQTYEFIVDPEVYGGDEINSFNFDWDFGDGQTETTPASSVFHTYNEGGRSYDVSVTARNINGDEEITLQRTIDVPNSDDSDGDGDNNGDDTSDDDSVFSGREGRTGGLVQCGINISDGSESDQDVAGAVRKDNECNFQYFLRLINDIINFLIILAIVISAIMFAVAGVMMITAGGNEERIKRARGIFKNVVIGLIIALTAWLIVNTIVETLIDDNYVFEGYLEDVDQTQ